MKRFARIGGLMALALALAVPAASRAAGPEDRAGRDLYLAVIQGLKDAGKPMAALAYLDDFDAHYPNQEAAAVLRADCLEASGDHDRAEPLYRRLAKGSRTGVPEAGLGRILAGRGDWAGAAAAYGEALKKSPADVRRLNDLGYALIKSGDAESALHPLRQATELSSNAAVSRNNLILALGRSGHDDEAQSLIQRIQDPKERAAVIAVLQQP